MFVEASFSIYLFIYFRELKPERLNGSKSIESHAILFKYPYSFSLSKYSVHVAVLFPIYQRSATWLY